MSLEKEFVPYEIALELKELGFNKPCFGYFYTEDKFFETKIKNSELDEKCSISAPTWHQAFSFFREKYGLHTWITSKTNDKEETVYIPHGRTLPDTIKNSLIVDIIPYYTGKTPEEAELECLKKLIEIAKK